jgi:hypothetical protein
MEPNIKGFFQQASRLYKLQCFKYRKDGIYYETKVLSYNLTELVKNERDKVLEFLDDLIDKCELKYQKQQIKNIIKDL